VISANIGLPVIHSALYAADGNAPFTTAPMIREYKYSLFTFTVRGWLRNYGTMEYYFITKRGDISG